MSVKCGYLCRKLDIIKERIHQCDDIEIRRKTILLYIACMVALVNLIPLGIFAFINKKPIVVLLNVSVTVVALYILVFLIKNGYRSYLADIGVSSLGALYYYLFITGGIDNTGHLWHFTFPLATSFLLGSKKGAIATSVLFLATLIYFGIAKHIPFGTVYPNDFIIRFTSSFICVFALSYIFENIREKIQKQLSEKNEDLEETINELKYAERALRESETSLKATLESTADGILVLNDQGQVIAANSRFSEMWNISENILKEDSSELLFHYMLNQLKDSEVFKSRVKELHNASKKDLGNISFEDGRVFEHYSEPLIVENRMAGRVWSFRDITENIQAENEKLRLQAKLQQAQKMEAIGTLAGGVAHDLNNVLSGIVSYPDLLLMQMPDDSPLRKPILTIRESGGKAAAIVQDLLTLARRGVATRTPMNLNDIIISYLKSPEYQNLISFHPDVDLEYKLSDDLLYINGSEVHLTKTVMNLITNAAEAIEKKGKIAITTQNRYVNGPINGNTEVKEGDFVTITVSDSGIGIPPEIQDRIFEPFYTKKKMGRSGTGLGMAVVWGTVKDHNGYIEIKSKEGKGTSFTLYFPAVKHHAVKKQMALPIGDYQGKGESILVIDDEKEQREIACSILSKLNYSVATVASGEQAVDYMSNQSVDILILDMIMDPGIDGLETYKRIQQLHPGQKAIIASGFSETARVKEAQRLGVGRYVKKPYTMEKIGIAIKEELAK